MLKQVVHFKDEEQKKYWIVLLVTTGVALLQLLAGISICYLTIKTAVKNGTRQALEEFNQSFEES